MCLLLRIIKLYMRILFYCLRIVISYLRMIVTNYYFKFIFFILTKKLKPVGYNKKILLRKCCGVLKMRTFAP